MIISRSICGDGNGQPLQYSCLENPMDGGAWWAAVHGVMKSRTWLSDFTFTFHFHALKKGMASHSSVLAWRIPGTGEPGGLPSMGSHRVGHDWSNLAAAAAGPSLFLPMALFHSFYDWVVFIVHFYHIFFIHSSVHGHLVPFMSWLLWLVLLWTHGCIYLFEL